eukprot:CAMPEP_0115069114 /NCGR_PEP_ID=MMETSP0227-20121206/12376_1 /TAXON_ID=89957 /ORGANISM="Polarella glacialis, Strain CCMP 1383" /LENGTH=365 /DNA_ID=CAMNT_0002455477 /DNA_START=108 /DNA_END=1202 /DNA_ORIENTATION=+
MTGFPMFGLVLAVGVFALSSGSAILGLDKWSGCGIIESGSNVPTMFKVYAPGQWEPMLTDVTDNIHLPDSVVANLKTAVSSNLNGCSAHSANYFLGKIALIARGGCFFSTKGLMAQQAGAVAMIAYNNLNEIGLLGVGGQRQNPGIPGYLIQQSEGLALKSRLDSGETLHVSCSWKPIKVWYGLPADSPEANDSLVIYNYGDQAMNWTMETKRWHMLADTFYAWNLTAAPSSAFAEGGSPLGSAQALSGWTTFNGSADLDDVATLQQLPFPFPHYLKYYSQVWVSSDGLLDFDSSFVQGALTSLSSSDGQNALIAPLWDNLTCNGCRINAAWSENATGVSIMAIRFQGMSFASSASAEPLTFEAW